jgi:nucleoside-diphosphate-sugar epimerase
MSVLLTGGTGFIGMEVLARFLERSEDPVFLTVRARDNAEVDARVRAILECLYGDGDHRRDRVFGVRADIEQPGLGLTPDHRAALADHITGIVHCAATVSFTPPLEEARRVNVEGTRHVLELAALCQARGNLDYFSHVSTAYVAGTHAGSFREGDLAVGQRFRNSYEQSKFEAERLVREQASRLPVQIFRPSIVVGEQSTGWTASFNVLYTPLKAFALGTLPALPARRSAPVDLVPVDYVADAIFELSRPGPPGCRTWHLVAGPRATTVGRLIELSTGRLRRPEPVVIPPTLFRRAVYPVLRTRGGRLRRGLDRTRVFFPYFEMGVTYENRKTRRRLEPAGIAVPPVESYFDKLVDYALAAQWGRNQLTRAEAAGRVPVPA